MQNNVETLQPLADKTAIGLSLICAVHCLLLPVAVVLLPALAALGLEDEAFHTWMVVFVLPVSAFALFMGCRKHRRYGVMLVGVAGLVVLSAGPVLGHEFLGEIGERALTLLGAALIAASHLRNYSYCRSHDSCACTD